MRSTKLIASVLFVCLGMFAQSDRGTITGTVVDPAGAVVANAPIEARSLETGAVYPAASTTTGNYTLAQLPVGTYELSAVVPGFKKYVRRGLTVQVAETLRIDVTLEVGSASESVTITADAPLLKTESGDLSYNVATARLDELPILGIGSVNAGSSQIRNPYAVTSLISGSYYAPIIPSRSMARRPTSRSIAWRDRTPRWVMPTGRPPKCSLVWMQFKRPQFRPAIMRLSMVEAVAAAFSASP